MSAGTPRIRSGAIVWGLVSTVTAIAVLVIASDPGRRTAVGEWAAGLSFGDAVGLAAVVLGLLIVLSGALAAIRRAQRRDPDTPAP